MSYLGELAAYTRHHVGRVFGRPPTRRPGGRARSRNFEAADVGRLFSGWTTTLQAPDSIIRSDLTKLQARSRDAFYNNPYFGRYIGLCVGHIVGPRGMTLQARSVGREGKLDTPANLQLEESFRDWGRAENCDYRGELTFAEQQRQVITSAAVDGAAYTRKHVGRQYGKYGLLLEHIDAALLNPEYNIDLPGGRYIRLGIERDGSGRKLAYHFKQSAGAQDGYTGYDGVRYIRIPAELIIHTYRPMQAGQTTGYPWAAPVLGPLKMLDAYFDAATTAARAGASKMGFFTSEDGAGYTGDGVDGDGALLTDFEAGVFDQLPVGVGFTAFDPRYPHEQFDPFVKACLRLIAGGLGVSYASLSNDLEKVNYSSSKIGLGDERANWVLLQNWFSDSYCRNVYETWLPVALLTEQIKVNRRPLSGTVEKYIRHAWQGRRWASPDPAKDMVAYRAALEINATSVSAVIQETTGRDPDEVFNEIAAEKATLAGLGLVISDIIPAKDTGGADQKPKSETDNAETK